MATTTGTKGSDVYTYDGVGDPRVALSVLLVRNQTETIIKDGLKKILYCSNTNIPGYEKLLEDAFVLAFMNRNIRGGSGERDVSKAMFKALYIEKPEIMKNLLDLIPHYGSWDDIFKIWGESGNLDVINKLTDIVLDQLDKDETNMTNNKSISLLAKWIPRQTRQANIAKHLAHKIFSLETSGNFSHRMKLYRHKIVKLNKYLETIEIKQCSKNWSDIKPETVPGRALAKYINAFLNQKKDSTSFEPRYPEDQDRIKCAQQFREHMQNVLQNEAKVKAVNTVLPSELYKNILMNMHANEDTKNINRAQWKMIRDDLKTSGVFKNMIAMCDFSGSMNGDPKLVSAALGILFSEICIGSGKNKIMTFDSTPQWIEFPESDDIYVKANILRTSSLGQGLSTDFQKAMELIISDLKKNRTPVDQAPSDLIVFTDMCWDAACGSNEYNPYTFSNYRHHVKTAPFQTHIEMIHESFKRAGEDIFGEGQGYQMPRIVIWNLRATSGEYHAQAHTEGVLMYSGWSPSVFKQLIKEGFKVQTPYDGLRQQLDDPMYDIIRSRIQNLKTEN
jgi:hypothetical protein